MISDYDKDACIALLVSRLLFWDSTGLPRKLAGSKKTSYLCTHIQPIEEKEMKSGRWESPAMKCQQKRRQGYLFVAYHVTMSHWRAMPTPMLTCRVSLSLMADTCAAASNKLAIISYSPSFVAVVFHQKNTRQLEIQRLPGMNVAKIAYGARAGFSSSGDSLVNILTGGA